MQVPKKLEKYISNAFFNIEITLTFYILYEVFAKAHILFPQEFPICFTYSFFFYNL